MYAANFCIIFITWSRAQKSNLQVEGSYSSLFNLGSSDNHKIFGNQEENHIFIQSEKLYCLKTNVN